MKKLRYIVLALLLVCSCFLLTACGGGADDDQEASEFGYVFNSTGEYARIVRYRGEGAEVVIPDTLGGKPVKEIGQYTFLSSPHVTSISIPAGITKIEDPSFYTLPLLETITVAEDNVGFTVVDGVLYHKKMGTIYCYPQGKKGDSYTIPDSVKTIYAHAFYNSQLKEVTMSDKVTKVQTGAFAESKNLTTVHFSSKTSQLFESAFENCSALAKLELPESLTSIGSKCFSGCSTLTEVTVPANVSVIDSAAFADCTALKTCAVLGKQVQRVAEDTFSGDTSLEKVSFAAGLMGIAENAFKNCSALTDVVLDDNLTTIGREAFYGCTALQNVVLPQTVTQVGARAFEGTAYLDGLAGEFVTAGNGVLLAYRGSATEVAVPATVRNVSWLNSTVTSVTVPEGVVALSDGAFENCEALTKIDLPASLTSMGEGCFRNCVGLTSFTVPAGLTTMGDACFEGCLNMEAYDVAAGNVSFSVDQGVLYDKIKKWLLWYPCNSSMTSYAMSFGPVKIGEGAVRYAKNLTSFDASLAEGVVNFSDYAFADCPNLTSVKVTNSFAGLGAHVFENCTALSDFEIKYTVTAIGEYCFRNCTSLKNMTLESPVSKIGVGAFEGMDCTFKVEGGSMAEEYVRAFGLSYKK